MEQYIKKSALVAEIENLENTYKKCPTRNSYEEGLKNGRLIGYKDALHKINTLEVKEVDLEKELSYENYMGFFKEYPEYGNGDWGYDEARIFANYFFKLGLKVKQESNDDVKIGETQIYLEDDGGEPPYDGKQWLDLSCTEYEIPKTLFKDGDNVEILIHKTQKGE